MVYARRDAGILNSLKMEKTAEGYLRGVARTTRTGVYVYRNADGTLRRELRHPDEVFKADSLNSMKMIPITHKHPITRLVDSSTAKTLTIGFTGETVQPDGKFVQIPVIIITQDGINAVEAGEVELSLGYEVELDNSPGNYEGAEYDYIQRNIKYNHLALVERGRAGPEVRLNVDAYEELTPEEIKRYSNIDSNSQTTTSTRSEKMVKLRLDTNIEYDVPPEVSAAFSALRADHETLKKSNDTLRANCDSLTATNANLQKRIDALPGEITAAATQRAVLITTAKSILPSETKLDSMDDNSIRKAVVMKVFPDAKLDGETVEYVRARFDSAVDVSKKTANINEDDDDSGIYQRTTVLKRGDNDDCSTEGKRKKMMDEMSNAYKGSNTKK